LPLLGIEPRQGFPGILTLACRDLPRRFSWVCRNVGDLSMVPPKRENESLKYCGHETSNEEISASLSFYSDNKLLLTFELF
jgi:hypothetical protein